MTYPDLPGAPVEFGGLLIDPVPTNVWPPGDLVLSVFGYYLKAVMLFRLSDAWQTVAGGNAPVVSRVMFNNPEDGTFNHRDLPGLYVYRDKGDNEKPERCADDLWEDTRRIFVHWIPNPVSQELRARRSPFLDAIRKVIKDAIFQERHAAWMVEGESDPYSLIKGSCITTVAGLWSPPIVEGVDETLLTFEIEGEKEKPEYTGLKARIRTVEGSMRDATGFPLAQNDGKIYSRDGTMVTEIFCVVMT